MKPYLLNVLLLPDISPLSARICPCTADEACIIALIKPPNVKPFDAISIRVSKIDAGWCTQGEIECAGAMF